MASVDSPPPVVVTERGAWDNPFARVRWSAVWAGLVAASGLQIVLAVLGAAVGFSVLGGGRAGVGLGEGIWLLVILIITLFIGGLVAGRLAPVRNGFESLIHGTLVWALSLMLAAWLIGSTASRVLGGALSLAGNLTGGALTAAGAIAGPVAANPAAAQSNFQRAADQARREAEQRGLTADSARALANNAADRVQTEAGEVAGQVQGATVGSTWITLAAIVLAFFAAWLGANRAMPERARRADL